MLNPDQISALKKEFHYHTSRSGGKGGQNVNKVETKVELQLDVNASFVLNAEQKQLILKKLQARINDEGILKVTESANRSQLENKEGAVRKIIDLINKALIRPKTRKPTKPSKASKRRKLESKKKRSEVKQWRKKIL